MEKREQEWMDRIKEETMAVEVPDSLQPENIERLLVPSQKIKTSKRHWIKGLAAASIFLVCGAIYMVNQSWEEEDVQVSSAGIMEEAAKDNVSKDFVTATEYEEVYSYVDAYWKKIEKENKGLDLLGKLKGETMDVAVEESAAADTTATGTSDYSGTNVRQQGVDEADVVKTDGRYLYILQDNGQAIAIVDTENGMELEDKIEVEEDRYIYEFYVSDEKLVYIAEKYFENNTAIMAKADYAFSTDSVEAVTFDISDVSNPVRVGSVSQSGRYTGSRMVDGYLYLFSQSYMNGRGSSKEPQTYIPMINEEIMKADQIYLPLTNDAYIYEIITSTNLDKPSETYDSKAVFTKGGQEYVSNKNIYWYETEWIDSSNTTIRKLSYQDGIIEAVAMEQIGGYINDSFSIDEHDSYLRVVTTEGDSNSVYVLDKDMEIVGQIQDVAKDERVYSARFMGEIGYFVTFRETDPLFTVDFSDPANPKIIGELKIPGFSEYLHLYGEGKLLGIGMDADEETGATDGVKLSMFDIQDPANVKEEATYIMKNVYGTDLFWDYKAVMIDVAKNVIGFSAYGNEEKYYIFSYFSDSSKPEFIKRMEETVNGNSYQATRGIYIGDILYVIKGNVIESYNMLNYEKIDDIIV